MIAASIAGFVGFIVPHYGEIKALGVQKKDYATILQNARTLQEQRNALVTKYNSFTPADLERLNVILPTNPQNVKLILELDALASRNGLLLQNVKIEDPSVETAQTAARPGTAQTNTGTGTLKINFTVAGPYNGFTQFMRSVEKSLRIIDVEKVAFTAADENAQSYQYTVSIKTYWLK